MIKKYNKILLVLYVILGICLIALAYYWFSTPRTFSQQQKAFLDDICTLDNEYLIIATVEGSGDVNFTVSNKFIELSDKEKFKMTKEIVIDVTNMSKKYDKLNNNVYVRVALKTADGKTIVKSNDKGYIEVVR